MHKLPVLILFLLISFFAFGSTTINCDNLEYAGKKLDFFQYSDPITKDIEFVFSLEFDEKGKCSTTVNSLATSYVFCDYGVYRGMFFLEPNSTIKLELPPVHEKSFSDSKNPYFSPVGFWFKT